MEMSYRGTHYDAQLPHLKADGVETIGTYRGAPVTRRRFAVNAPQRRRTLIYRGVTYEG